MSSFYNRLISLKFPKEKNYQFSKRMGVAVATVIGWKNGGSPRRDLLERISKLTGVSMDWLLTGEGEMMAVGQAIEPTAHPDYLMVPLIDGRVTAGPDGGILYDEPVDQYPFKKAWAERKFSRSHLARLVLVRVQGDSMIPTIGPGDLALVDSMETERQAVRNGHIYMIRMPDGAITIKRLCLNRSEQGAGLLCLSDNPSYQPFEFPIPTGRELTHYILGRIRWCGREFD